MHADDLRGLLTALRDGTINVDAAFARLRDLPFEDVGFARLDHLRAIRTGFPEAVLAEGKTPAQVAELLGRLADRAPVAVATRATEAHWHEASARLAAARYEATARLIVVGEPPEPPVDSPFVLVCSAGTADLPVAEEAALTLELAGTPVRRLYDVGVAGVHRLLAHRPLLDEAAVIVVVAGMDGALPSVVGGLAAAPVVAVPTSVGYGASFGGVAALLTMLNSCAAGVTVVNIDNGFGAGVAAFKIVRARGARSTPACPHPPAPCEAV